MGVKIREKPKEPADPLIGKGGQMEGENGEINDRRPNKTGPHVNETEHYWVKGVTLGVIPISRPIHGRCLNNLLKNTTDPSEAERLSRSPPIEAGRRDLRCYVCHKYLDL